jgi:hypothetical protein
MKLNFDATTDPTLVPNIVVMDRNAESFVTSGGVLNIVNTTINTSRTTLFADTNKSRSGRVTFEGNFDIKSTVQSIGAGILVANPSTSLDYFTLFGVVKYYSGAYLYDIASIEAMQDAPTIAADLWAKSTTVSSFDEHILDYAIVSSKQNDGTVKNSLVMEWYLNGTLQTDSSKRRMSWDLGVGFPPLILGPAVMVITGGTATAVLGLQSVETTPSITQRSLS